MHFYIQVYFVQVETCQFICGMLIQEKYQLHIPHLIMSTSSSPQEVFNLRLMVPVSLLDTKNLFVYLTSPSPETLASTFVSKHYSEQRKLIHFV